MTSNFIKFCTAALAGSMIGIAYERWPTDKTWSNPFHVASAASSLVPRNDDIEPIKQPNFNQAAAADNLKHSLKYGLPSKDNIRLFNDFILSYDRRLRSAAWVMEHLTPDKLIDKGLTDRDESKFHEDKEIHEYFRAKNADFRKSGYDRGHLAAAGNHKLSQDDLDQTFFFTNISPQLHDLNAGPWKRLEAYVRWRANRSKNLYVISGPLYLPMRARDGNLYVTYRVLGNNHISVPTHYFKVFLVETNNGKLELEAFLMPNDKFNDPPPPLDDFRVNLDRLDVIERASGIIFFDEVSRNKLEAPKSLAEGFVDGDKRNKKKLK